jgi:hypothetical protein
MPPRRDMPNRAAARDMSKPGWLQTTLLPALTQRTASAPAKMSVEGCLRCGCYSCCCCRGCLLLLLSSGQVAAPANPCCCPGCQQAPPLPPLSCLRYIPLAPSLPPLHPPPQKTPCCSHLLQVSQGHLNDTPLQAVRGDLHTHNSSRGGTSCSDTSVCVENKGCED